MKQRSILLLCLSLISLSGCEETPPAQAIRDSTSDQGTFSVAVNGTPLFNDQTPGSRVHLAGDSLVAFKTRDHYVRVFGLQLDDTADARTEVLNLNNTQFATVATVDGKSLKVGCDPAQKPIGFFHRRELTPEWVSGEFSAQFISCTDYLTGAAVNYPSEPLTVTGRFTRLKLKQP